MYIVIEIQTTDKVATLTTSYEDRNQAEAKYHAVLSAAAVSAVPKHAAVMLTEEGTRLKSECYIHEQPEPEEDPEA